MNQEGTLGNSIKTARKDMSYTLEELGERVGVTHAFLSRVENNKVKPSDELLEKIVKELDPFNSKDLKNEFKILTGNYDGLDETSEFFKELKKSGRIEINNYGENKNNIRLVDRPFYKLNFLFENDYKVFYDLKTSILGENIATIELPPGILDDLYKKINLTIIEHIKEHPYLLKSLEDPKVLDKYLKKEEKKRFAFREYYKYMNLNESMDELLSSIMRDDKLI
ncbi:helix-turn-helix domain-containing protein [Staphylococcus hominis]|uniref:helix-turn-helix domain-containing protein n=1 Tax=Staphylococcus hominis TaxID=1290 RepID=UPI00321B5A4F